MPLITWDAKDEVNVQQIDDQHRTLVALVNELHQAMRLRSNRETLRKILSRLIDFTRAHFAAEERLMLEHLYPQYENHRSQHSALLDHIAELEKQVQEGDILLSFAIALDLKGWAINHITFADKPLGEFLNSRGVF